MYCTISVLINRCGYLSFSFLQGTIRYLELVFFVCFLLENSFLYKDQFTLRPRLVCVYKWNNCFRIRLQTLHCIIFKFMKSKSIMLYILEFGLFIFKNSIFTSSLMRDLLVKNVLKNIVLLRIDFLDVL
jgi:hypothetical protein